MEKILDATLGVIEIVAFSSIIGFGGYKGLQFIHDKVREETINTLKVHSGDMGNSLFRRHR